VVPQNSKENRSALVSAGQVLHVADPRHARAQTNYYDVIQVDTITTSCEYWYRYRYGRSDSWSYCVSAV